jgi:hypothetical protein
MASEQVTEQPLTTPPLTTHHSPAALNKIRLTILVAMMFSLLVAGIFRTPPIVFMAALLCAAPPAAIFLGRWSSKRLNVTRTVPASGPVGSLVYGQLLIENNGRLPAFLTEVRAGEVKAPDGEMAIVAEAGGLQDVTMLHGGQSTTRLQAWRFLRRGVFHLPPPRAGSTDPLGLFNELQSKGQAQEITILPRVLRLDKLGFIGGSAARLQAPQHSTVVADAMDFHGVRPYYPGEPIRRVHWKSTARTGQLQIVEWEENVARDLAVILDNSRANLAGKGPHSTLEAAITAAASVAQHLLEGGYAFQIFAWRETNGGAQLWRYEARNAAGIAPLLYQLAHLEIVNDTAATLERLASEAALSMPPTRAALLLASTRAPIEAARRPFAARAAFAPCYTIAFDAASFDGEVANAAAWPPRDALTRIVRNGDSLAAALEQVA